MKVMYTNIIIIVALTYTGNVQNEENENFTRDESKDINSYWTLLIFNNA